MEKHFLLNQLSRGFFLLIVLLLVTANSAVLAQTTTFTYQGRLTDGGTPANGTYDLQFGLFDSMSSGGQIGATQSVPSVSVSSGIFTVSLDFGAGAFTGANRYLEISARLGGSGSFILLAPRQPITSTPYAVRSLRTTVADGLSSACAGCVLDANISTMSGSKLSGTIPVASVPAGSTSYIQNTSSPQTSSNFNISGTGTASVLNATGVINTSAQYNIANNRVLSIPGPDNTFVGLGAGANNSVSGLQGTGNSFFGRNAGNANTSGELNSFFGMYAGLNTTGGTGNAFFGAGAGEANTSGDHNSFFGKDAGNATIDGTGNAFFGVGAGDLNTSGNANVFLGTSSGRMNMTGHDNTIIGTAAGVASSNLSFATAIGSRAVVDTSNTIMLGRQDGSDFVYIPGFLTIPNLAAAGNTQLCRNVFDRVGACSSSLRYKTNLAVYRSGLNVINRLRPISFTWKEGGMRDLGFGAEDVEKIDPLLVTYNKEGQVEGVKYDRINVVLVNAIREQQDQIERQQAEVRQQQNQIKALRMANVALNARLRGIEKVLRQSLGASRRRR